MEEQLSRGKPSKRGVVARTIGLFALPSIGFAATGFYFQSVEAGDVHVWFSRTGAILVGWSIAAEFFDKWTGFFTGAQYGTWAAGNFDIDTLLFFGAASGISIVGTLIWAFGDLTIHFFGYL